MNDVGSARANIEGDTYTTVLHTRGHKYLADEPASADGRDKGPTPVEMLAGSLASCTAITVRMYARRKGWDVTMLECEATAQRESAGPGGTIDRFHLRLKIEGDLTEDQIKRLHDIAHKCPVHLTLAKGAQIVYES